MQNNLQKIKKELTEYFKSQGIEDTDIQTSEYVSDDNSDSVFENLAYSPCESGKSDEPCASYSDYDYFKDELEEYLEERHNEESFFDLVEMHLREKGLKPAQVYTKAQLSRQDYSRYVRVNSEMRNRTVVFNLAIGLELDGDETKRLLRSAGFGYNKRSKFDLIVMFCIKKKLYDILFINMLLDEFGQPLLKVSNSKEN